MVCTVDVRVDEALSKSEMAKSELEIEISKVRMEAAGLRDALVKMQNLNEGLGQDKDDLNRLIIQVNSQLLLLILVFLLKPNYMN